MPTRAGLVYNPYQLPGGSSGPGVAQIPEPPALQVPEPRQPQQTQRVMYNPQSRQFLINNVLVDRDDVEYLQRSSEFLSEPIQTDVPEGDWQTVNPNVLSEEVERLSRVSGAELVGAGTRAVAAGLLRGTGMLGEQLGLPSGATDLLRRAGEAADIPEHMQGRMAAAAERNTLLQNMLAAVPQGAPSFAASIGGAAIGGFVGGPVGAAFGGFMTILPMMVDSAYQSAVQHQGQDFADSPEGRAEVISTAVLTSIVQAPVPSYVASRGLAMLSRKATDETLRRRGPGRLATAGVVGLTEAAAEASALAIEMAVFDPEARSMLDQGDIQALMPYIVQTYGEELAISAFAGGVLGGGAGLIVGGNPRTREGKKAADGEVTDLNRVSEEQALSSPVYPLATPVGDPARPLSGAQVRQGVLPFGEFSEQDTAELSRAVGLGTRPRTWRQDMEFGDPEEIADFIRPDATDTTGQGTLPFAIPETHQLAGPAVEPEVVDPGVPPVDPVQQNLFDFGVPISPRQDQTPLDAIPEPELVSPMTANQFGTTTGRPFRNKGAASGQLNRIASEQELSRDDLEVVEVQGGFAVQAKEGVGQAEVTVEEGVRRPSSLYRGFGMREYIRRSEGVTPTRRGLFLTENREYAGGRYTRSTEGVGGVLETKNIPTNPLNIDHLAAKTKKGEAARKKMLKQLKDFVAQNENYTAENIEDSYINEVLVEGENDFTQPTDLDVDFLQSLGYDSVYFSTEGPIGSGIETTDVNTWYVFENPFNDYVGEMRRAMGIKPGERTVTENREQIGWDETAPPIQETRSPEEVAEEIAAQAVTPEDAWSAVSLRIKWDQLGKSEQSAWTRLVESNPADTVENPNIQLIVDSVFGNNAKDVYEILQTSDITSNSASLSLILNYAFDSEFNKARGSKAARQLARNELETVLAKAGKDERTEALLVKAARGFFNGFSKTHVNKFNNLVGDRVFDTLLAFPNVRNIVEDHYNVPMKGDGTFPTKAELKEPNKASNAKDAAGQPTSDNPNSDKNNAGTVLASRLNDFENYTDTKKKPSLIEKNRKELKKLWKNVVEEGYEDAASHIPGQPLSAFFMDGEPLLHPVTGRPVTTLMDTQEAQRSYDKIQDDTARAAKDAADAYDALAEQEGSLDDAFAGTSTSGRRGGRQDSWDVTSEGVDNGRYQRADGKTITKPVETGRARLAVRKFLRGLTNKPSVKLYRNKADFQNKNPEGFREVMQGREDFATTPVSAVYYGDGNVVVFLDSVLSVGQLNVILAHETLGHFGLRAIMPPVRLNNLLDRIYNDYDVVRQAVNESIVAETDMALEDISSNEKLRLQREFTEEYLADMAAVLETNILARIWNAAKTFLERLTGVQFDDHLARYFLNQSRRYVRNGKVDSSLLNWHDMGKRIMQAESGYDPYNKVMFARDVRDAYAVNRAAALARDVMGIPMTVQSAGDFLRKAGINTKGAFETAVEQLFSLRTFRFRENPGAEAVFDAVTKGKNTAMRVINETNEILRSSLDRKAFDKIFGQIDSKQYKAANDMIYEAMFYNINKFNAKVLGKTSLVVFDHETGKVTANTAEIERLRSHGELTLEQFKTGVEYEVQLQDGEEGATLPEKRSVTARPDLEKSSPEWQAYEAAREAVAYIWVEKIKADYEGFLQERDLNFRRIAQRMDNDKLTPEDNALLLNLSRKAYEIQEDGMEVDPTSGAVQYSQEASTNMNTFLENVNRALLQIESADKETMAIDAVAEKFGETQGPLVAEQLRSMSRRLNFNKAESVRDEKFVVQNALKDIIMHELQTSQSERLAKQSLAQGYAPLKRRGRWQMRIVAKNERGEVVRLDDNLNNMLSFRMFDDEGETLAVTNKVNETMFTEDGSPVVFNNIRAYDSQTNSYRPTRITLEAIPERAMTEQAGPPHLNLNEFMVGLRRFGIVLHPSKMNEVVIAMTKQNNSARNKLLREGKRGYDPDALRAVSEFAESMGSNIGKTLMRPQISEYMDMTMKTSQDLWNGSRGYLEELRTKWESLRDNPAADEKAVEAAMREYRKYAFQYRMTNPKNRAKRGNTYRNDAANLLAFLDGNSNFKESTFESGPVVSRLRAYTSIFQLGGSIATGALNYIGMWMNGVPTLASYNEERAFGGGFGLGKSVAEVSRAMNQVGLVKALANSRFNDAGFYEEMVGDSEAAKALRKKHGLEEHEAQFIQREIAEGVMIPAQTNATVSTARGYTKFAAARKLIDGWMWTFNQTEQGSRRSLGLAAFRLEYERQKAAMTNPNDVKQQQEAIEKARRFAVETIDQTVGRYDVSNRPPVWRSGLPAMAYMYKVFPTTSIQMMRNLSRNGKIGFLFGLWLLSGIRGFPFAEDIEDLIDTIAQGLGLKWRGTRIEMAEQVDKVFPGFSPTFIRGALNRFSAGDIGIRTQLGSFAPGTGMFLAGANTAQELGDIGGPMIGMLSALGETIPNAMRWAAGNFTGDQRVSFNDVMRTAPITMMRALGDSLAYTSSGAIVDRRGYVIAPDVHVGQILFRLGGWYPRDAAQQYDIVRASQRMANYQRDTAASYRIAWIKAMMQDDLAKARSIERSVDDWNRATRGTGLEIRNFRVNSFRALREARLPAVDRTMRTLPISARQDMEMTADLLGYN